MFFINLSESKRKILNDTPFMNKLNRPFQNNQNNDSEINEKLLNKLRRQSKSIHKETNNNMNDDLQQKISGLQDVLSLDKFKNEGHRSNDNEVQENNKKTNDITNQIKNNQYQNLNLFHQNNVSYPNVRRSLNFDAVENEKDSQSLYIEESILMNFLLHL